MRVSKVQVLLVDDQAVIRDGLKAMLSTAPGIAVAGEARDGQEAIALVRQCSPDVILMDIRMPDMDGLEVTRRLRDLRAPASVIMLTMYQDIEYLLKAINCGAAGYLVKDVDADTLITTIQTVAAGGSIIEPQLLRTLLRRIGTIPAVREQRAEKLTRREEDVLILLGKGLSNREIADQLVLSMETVKSHVSAILSKLNLTDRTQAAIYAVRHGLIPDEEGA
jgi:DNA-binding NarL/FixJ family response regulator